MTTRIINVRVDLTDRPLRNHAPTKPAFAMSGTRVKPRTYR